MKIVINPQYKNLSHFVHELPQNFDNTGKVLHQGRNQAKLQTAYGSTGATDRSVTERTSPAHSV